jgi:hypothetical protein
MKVLDEADAVEARLKAAQQAGAAAGPIAS